MQKNMNSSCPPISEILKRFEYNPETGLFRRKRVRDGLGEWTRGSKTQSGYFRIMVKGSSILAHRAAFAITYGKYPNGVIDHINGDKADNRLLNLRCVTHEENMKNRFISLDEKGKFKGCYLVKTTMKWRAEARIGKQVYRLGTFADEESAHQAYMNFMSERIS